MKNNKILMSLVVASISAMAAAPFVLSEGAENADNLAKNLNDESNLASNQTAETVDAVNNVQNAPIAALISMEEILASTLKTGAQNEELQKDLSEQTLAMLNKRDTLQPLYEGISIVAENYGITKDKILRHEVYDNFNFGYSDSTASGGSGAGTHAHRPDACHWACHSACHSACHGSRGWR